METHYKTGNGVEWTPMAAGPIVPEEYMTWVNTLFKSVLFHKL